MQFDAEYYERYYTDPETCAASSEEQARQVALIAAYLRYLDIPVDTILDVGCGLGHFLAACATHYPEANLTGVEVSEHLCAELGWTWGSVVDFESPPADLVICNDVLAYLEPEDCEVAIENLGNLTQTALFLHVLTEEDVEICDIERSDPNQYLRPAEWYRTRLAEHFVSVGAGLFLKLPLEYPLWQLERAQ